MATEDRNVKILAWPPDPAKLEHQFDKDKPCPVTISFEETPAHIIMENSSRNPFHVNMKMNVLADRAIPLCIKLCEPVCVKSDYTIGIDIFDRPVGTIRIKGLSRLFNCKESNNQPTKPICVDFSGLKFGSVFENPFIVDLLKFSPLDLPLKVVNFGEPEDRNKLLIPSTGMRIDFPMPVSDVVLTINNYAGNKNITITSFSDTTVLDSVSVTIDNEYKECSLIHENITAIEIMGGNNEASLIQVCYRGL